MNTCKTCKWWGFETRDDHFRMTTPSDKKICGNPNIESSSSDGIHLASYDGSDLFTGPDFGCIHHEPK